MSELESGIVEWLEIADEFGRHTLVDIETSGHS